MSNSNFCNQDEKAMFGMTSHTADMVPMGNFYALMVDGRERIRQLLRYDIHYKQRSKDYSVPCQRICV